MDITGALFILRIQYKYTQTQCKEGADDINFGKRTFDLYKNPVF